MPTYPVPWKSSDPLYYYLVPFNEDGTERLESGKALSKTVMDVLQAADNPFTDVFILSHGWKFDEAAAKGLYERWMLGMHDPAVSADVEMVHNRPHGFKPLIVCIYWPSQMWDRNEYLPNASTTPVLPPPATQPEDQVNHQVEKYSAAIASSDAAKGALRIILKHAQRTENSTSLPDEVLGAYKILYDESGLRNDSPDDQPGADHPPFDPQAVVQHVQKPTAITASVVAAPTPDPGPPSIFDKVGEFLLTPLRQLSFWQMKARAKVVGEKGGHPLLKKLQATVASQGQSPGFHLMGHSFGCIVVSAAIAGQSTSLDFCKVHSLFLAQGALSLWAYADHIYAETGPKGHYNRIFTQGLVRGSVVTTQSIHDKAVAIYFPIGVELDHAAHGNLDNAPRRTNGDRLPRYGGVGAFGIQGLANGIAFDQLMEPTTTPYTFQPAKVYNLDGSKYICDMQPFSGAHNDIIHPEVAHAFWSAVLVEVGAADGL